MAYLKSIVFGGFVGLVGAAVWAGIAYFAGYEVGWVAWGIGALVGVAVRFASKPDVSYTAEDAIRELHAESDQIGPGSIAAAIAIVAVLVGKYLAVVLLLGNISLDDLGEELVISYVADGVVAEYTADGRSVSWPESVDPQFAVAEVDYPSDVWAEASQRWQAKSPEAKTVFAEETAATVTTMMEQNTAGVWLASFAMMDLLWFGLAAWTAFKIGASGSEE